MTGSSLLNRRPQTSSSHVKDMVDFRMASVLQKNVWQQSANGTLRYQKRGTNKIVIVICRVPLTQQGFPEARGKIEWLPARLEQHCGLTDRSQLHIGQQCILTCTYLFWAGRPSSTTAYKRIMDHDGQFTIWRENLAELSCVKFHTDAPSCLLCLSHHFSHFSRWWIYIHMECTHMNHKNYKHSTKVSHMEENSPAQQYWSQRNDNTEYLVETLVL